MMTLRELIAAFPTEDDCRKFLVERRWPKGEIKCPRCGAGEHVYALQARPWHWECSDKSCRSGNAYRFSITTGTVFENTKYPLKVWFEVLWQMLNSKKGVSAAQVQRQIGAKSYQTAWYMCHRLRAAMQDDDFCQLMGIVEIDETYIGGKDRNRHKKKRSGPRGPFSGKVGVIGAISRKGNVVTRVIERLDQRTVDSFVSETISSQVSLVATDDCARYKYVYYGPGVRHESVNHSDGEYVRGNIHTASIDSFWALLKRGVVGTYHNVSRKYLPLYLAEFQFRHNNRDNPDMFDLAIAGC